MLLASGVVCAEGADPVAARAQLRQGYALKQQGKCKEAIPYLEESLRLDRQPKTLLNLGDCEQAVGQLAPAQTHFIEARDLARHQKNEVLKTIAEKRLQDLEKRMPKLTIELAKDAPPNTVVTRDGIEVGPVSLRTALPIDIGQHVIVVRGGGFERQYQVTLAEGEAQRIEVTPIGGKPVALPATAGAAQPAEKKPTAETAPPASTPFRIEAPAGDRVESGSSTQRTFGYVTLGVGAVGLGAGGFFAARTLSRKSELADMCTEYAPCNDEEAAVYQNTKRAAQNARMYSAIGFGAGGAAAITGVILLLTAPKSSSSALRVAPTIGQNSVGAFVAGSW